MEHSGTTGTPREDATQAAQPTSADGARQKARRKAEWRFPRLAAWREALALAS